MLVTTEFYGFDLSDFEAEKLQIEKHAVKERAFKKEFKKESQLNQVKWFDNRILHPVVATYLYAAEYRRVYRAYYTKSIDHEKAKYVKGFSGDDAWVAKSANGFVKGRQQADSMCIPYWFYIQNAFEWLYIKKWKHMPRHVHLYNDEVIAFVASTWEIYKRETITIAELPFFREQKNQYRPEYIAHQEWLRELVSMSTVPKIATESLNERGFFF